MKILYADVLGLLERRKIFCRVHLEYGSDPKLVEMQSSKSHCIDQGDLRWVLMEVSTESATYFKLLTGGGRRKSPLRCNHLITVEVATVLIEGKRLYAGLTLAWEDVNPETDKLEEHVVHCGNIR
jgi:hypothetical protein